MAGQGRWRDQAQGRPDWQRNAGRSLSQRPRHGGAGVRPELDDLSGRRRVRVPESTELLRKCLAAQACARSAASFPAWAADQLRRRPSTPPASGGRTFIVHAAAFAGTQALSSESEFSRPHVMNSMMTEIGNAAAMDAVCSAVRPPASSSTPATNASPRPRRSGNAAAGCRCRWTASW